MEPKNFYLKTFNLATNLTEARLSEFTNNITQKEAKKGQVVYAKGGEKKVFILVSGHVKISEINEKGRNDQRTHCTWQHFWRCAF